MQASKKFYAAFFSIFIAVGLGMAIFGLVRLGQYYAAEEVQATVISAKYNQQQREMDVVLTFERDGKEVTAKGHFLNIKVDNKGRLPYYEGQQKTVRVNRNNEVVSYGDAEIAVTAGGGAFFLFGGGFMYFFVLKKKSLFDMADEYEQAMVNPEELTDQTQILEAQDDQLSKLPAYSIDRKMGEAKVWKGRLHGRLSSFTVAENVFCTILLVGSIIAVGLTLKSVLFGCIFGLFAFCFVLLILKAAYNLYFAVSAKRGKFTEKRLAVVEMSVFESSGSFQNGELSRTHTTFKKFRVIATIDGTRSVGYVKGNVPPPQGAVLKVLIRPNKPKRWIIDNTPDKPKRWIIVNT